MAGNLKASFRNVDPQTGGQQKCWQSSQCQFVHQEGWVHGRDRGVPARAAPSPLNPPSTDSSPGHVRRMCQRVKAGESFLVLPFSWKLKQLQPPHCTVKEMSIYSLSQMALLISTVWSDCAQDGPGGSFQPLSGLERVERKGWGDTGHQPALHAKLTGLSAPPHASTFTSVGGLDMDFRISQEFRLSPLNFLSRMWLTNIHWTSVKCSSINHMWSHKISIPNACHNKFIFYCCNK